MWPGVMALLVHSKVEESGVWPDGLLDAYIAVIPKTDGDATPLGQHPVSVLPVVYYIWASARMVQLEDWFRSWVPDSVFSAWGGRGSVEAWYTTALDIEKVLCGPTDSNVHSFVADVINPFDTADDGVLDRSSAVCGCLIGSVMPILSIMRLLGCGLSLLLVLGSHGLVMGPFLRAAL